MKVSELIEKLKILPPDMECITDSYESGQDYVSVTNLVRAIEAERPEDWEGVLYQDEKGTVFFYIGTGRTVRF
jgi:hypothetical protein